MAELTMRALTEDDHETLAATLARGFLNDGSPEWLPYQRAVFEPDRVLGVFDADRLVGTAQILSRELTLPGPRSVPIAAISAVVVAADHRRRGVLSRLMRAQLHGLHEQGGEPIAALWASESRIYRRFGYGLASEYSAIELGREELRADIELSTERVRELPRDQAMPLITARYDELAPRRVGWLSRRSAGSWMRALGDQFPTPPGVSSPRFVVHPDGYAVYRTKPGRDDRGPDGTLWVTEVVARTPAAYATLWRYLLSMDLVRTVEAHLAPEDPLFHLLAEPMAVVRRTKPALWVRLIDLDRALAGRAYRVPGELVFAVTDELCPWNAGRWRLSVDPSGEAKVIRTEDEPDLALDVLELGGAFLGGTRLSTLAATGRVRELTEGSLARATATFLADDAPASTEVF